MHTTDRLFISILTRTIVSLLLVAMAVAVFVVLVQTRPTAEPAANAETAPRVIVIKSARVEVARQWSGYGTARAMDTADVPARVTATVIDVPEDILAGAKVKAGELLVKLDQSDFTRQVEISTRQIEDIDAQLAQLTVQQKAGMERAELATRQVELARAELTRAKEAFEREAAQQREVDQARQALLTAIESEVAAREAVERVAPQRASLQAQRSSAASSLNLARQTLERTTIVSPISGSLQSVDVEQGENIQAGQRIARVVSLDRIEVVLRLPAGARGSVQIGDAVRLNSTGSIERVWQSRVDRIAPEDEDQTRTVTVYAELVAADTPQPPAPGMFLHGRVIAGEKQSRTVIPRRALQGGRIRLIRDGVVVSRGVQIAYEIQTELRQFDVEDKQWVVLEEPLAEDVFVVLNGTRSLPESSAATPVIEGEGEETTTALREDSP